jgi:hypothetical protein
VKRFLAVIAATASAAGMIVAAVPAASAAAESQIRTYTDTFNLSLTGVGTEKGFCLRMYYRSRVIRSPRLAFYIETVRTACLTGIQITQQWYFVGGHNYLKYNDNLGWEKSTPTASQIRTYEKTSNVQIVITQLYALPGLHRVDASHYLATDTVAQIGRFLSYSFGVDVEFLYVNDFTSLAVGFSTDSAGRPVSLVITGDSSDMRLNIADAFTYNRPTAIQAP